MRWVEGFIDGASHVARHVLQEAAAAGTNEKPAHAEEVKDPGIIATLIAWPVAILFLGFVVITVIWEFCIALLTFVTVNYTGRKALWVSRLKDEILALGVITLTLVVIEASLANICIKGTEETFSHEEYPDHHCPEGEHLLFTRWRILQTHLLLFALAVVFILYACTSLYICIFRLRMFRKWELQAKIGAAFDIGAPIIFRRLALTGWAHGFRMTLWNSWYSHIPQETYTMLRLVFRLRMDAADLADPLPRQANFLNIVEQAMEVNFSEAAKYAWVLSIGMAIFLVIPIELHALYWLFGISAIIMMVCAAKLQSIVVHLSAMAYYDFYVEIKSHQAKLTEFDPELRELHNLPTLTPDCSRDRHDGSDTQQPPPPPTAAEHSAASASPDDRVTAPSASLPRCRPASADQPRRTSAGPVAEGTMDGRVARFPSSARDGGHLVVHVPAADVDHHGGGAGGRAAAAATKRSDGGGGGAPLLGSLSGRPSSASWAAGPNASAVAGHGPIGGGSSSSNGYAAGLRSRSACQSASAAPGGGAEAVGESVAPRSGTNAGGGGGGGGDDDLHNPLPSAPLPPGYGTQQSLSKSGAYSVRIGEDDGGYGGKAGLDGAPSPGSLASPGGNEDRHVKALRAGGIKPECLQRRGAQQQQQQQRGWWQRLWAKWCGGRRQRPRGGGGKGEALRDPKAPPDWIVETEFDSHRHRTDFNLKDYDGKVLRDISALFWFKSPTLMLWMFQVCYMENSLSLTILIYGLIRDSSGVQKEANIGGIVALIVLDLALLIFSSTAVLPVFALINTAATSRPQALIEEIRVQKMLFDKEEYEEGIGGWLLRILHITPGVNEEGEAEEHLKRKVDTEFILMLADQAGVVTAFGNHVAYPLKHEAIYRQFSAIWQSEAEAWHRTGKRNAEPALVRGDMTRFQETFAWLDKDRDIDDDGTGFGITAKELAREMRRLGTRCTMSELKDMIAEVDHDGSKEIGFQEYVLFMCFKFYDHDNDGFIDIRDIAAAMVVLDVEPKDPEEYSTMIHFIEHANEGTGDDGRPGGRVELDEFLRFFLDITFEHVERPHKDHAARPPKKKGVM